MEHAFFTLKRLWGFAKVRYRGLAKNANRTLALIDIDKWSNPLGGFEAMSAPKAPSELQKWLKRGSKTSKIHETSTAKY